MKIMQFQNMPNYLGNKCSNSCKFKNACKLLTAQTIKNEEIKTKA